MGSRFALGFSLLVVASIAGAQKSVPATLIPRTDPEPAFVWDSLKVGETAPDFTAYTVDGKAVKLSDYKGKVVILDFWASWCGPCQISMPGLEKIYQQIKGKNVVVLSLDTWDEKPDFVKWVKENAGTKYSFNFVRDPAEGDHQGIRAASIAKRLYKVVGIPTMYVIDAKGKIAGGLIGANNEPGLVKILGKQGLKATAPKA